MIVLFSKSLLSYAIGILFIVAITGGILSPIVDNFFVLISVLVIEYIIFIIILLHFFDKYIKPIKKASRTVDQLVQGNYQARVRDRKSTRLNSSHVAISYAVFCLKK